ncbi:DUF5597 domain-containing protein [Alteromonas gilva]|uniref:DUF5597 domain-containing protein n=1 Tax=Alteromonas gilva TaxID=2987522 RepID=A0ABT5KY83_9ALTE|nr:DUF5597 domain-containing protein [Alteromonas gilva]MDC8829211.1 DUF5597 domain-containing protein [Alteromonas gilva]
MNFFKYMSGAIMCVLGLTACQSANVHHQNRQSQNASQASVPLPDIVTREGKHAFLVDGEPFLLLGAQTNNSANYPAMLDKVWPVVAAMQANTLGIPVAWEQIEPVEGQFDFSFLDVLIEQAAERDIKVVLLWFATWKNNAPHYAPAWVKLDNQRFPRVVTENKRVLNSLSPHGKNTLAADKKAFVRLMTYLRDHDPEHQVIMVQVQNEVGTYGSKRDFSPAAEALFNQTVPEALLKLYQQPAGTWQQVFGENADEYFHAWSIGRYVDDIAAAGKAVKDLPMNVNVALRNPFNPGDGYSMGGPTDNVIDIWKVAAPHIDMISPDIYFRDHKTVNRVLELYSRDDNPLFVAEIGNDQPYARYFFSTLGKQGIGFAPFGMDYTDYANFPLGAKVVNDETIAPFAELYSLMAPWASVWAKLSFENDTWGVAEPHDSTSDKAVWNARVSAKSDDDSQFQQTLDLGRWNAEVSYGRPMFWIDPPTGNHPASGGALIAKLGEDEYLITALRARVTLSPSSEIEQLPYMIERVEEGHFDADGNWVFERVWNGDQTDWGLNFTSQPHILKVKMATYKQ